MIGCTWLCALILLLMIGQHQSLIFRRTRKMMVFLTWAILCFIALNCVLKPHSLKACNFLEIKEVNMWDPAEIQKKKNLKKRQKNLLFEGVTHLKIQVHALKLSTSIAYRQFKRISLHKRVVEISNKLPNSIIKAEWYKSAQEGTESIFEKKETRATAFILLVEKNI